MPLAPAGTGMVSASPARSDALADFELRPGVMARVGPRQRRQILPGPEGIRFVALGGLVGVHQPSAWTELGGLWPEPTPA